MRKSRSILRQGFGFRCLSATSRMPVLNSSGVASEGKTKRMSLGRGGAGAGRPGGEAGSSSFGGVIAPSVSGIRRFRTGASGPWCAP
jgi:hypothetical protein